MIRTSTAKRLMKELADRFDVEVRVYDFGHAEYGACTDPCTRVIEINTRMGWTQDRLLSYAMHEIVHVLAYFEDKFIVYHSPKTEEYLTDDELRKYIATAFRAELWVEERACRMFKEMYPTRMYWRAYRGRKDHRIWFEKSEIDPYRKELLTAKRRRRRLRRIDKEMRERNK